MKLLYPRRMRTKNENTVLFLYQRLNERSKFADRRTDRKTNRQTGRRTDRQADREADIKTRRRQTEDVVKVAGIREVNTGSLEILK